MVIGSRVENLYHRITALTKVKGLKPLLFIVSALLISLLSLTFTGSITLSFIIFLSFAILTVLEVLKLRRLEINEIIAAVRQIRLDPEIPEEKLKLNPGIKLLEDEIKLMHKRINEDIGYLRKLEKVRTEFLGNVSHELKTPIFAIQGYVETLINGAINDPKVNKYFLEKALHHTNNLNNLVSDLIDISMIESGEMRMSFRYFDANEFFAGIISEYKNFAEEKNLRLDYRGPEKAIQIFADKVRLKQAVNNLVMNALKYTEKGEVVISLEDNKKNALISVSDTGIGIPLADLGRIFERFYRVDKDRSREVGGTGLGLAIVKHIVEAHGSKVTVRSIPGEGSVFSFSVKK